jgi:hypothetical protein
VFTIGFVVVTTHMISDIYADLIGTSVASSSANVDIAASFHMPTFGIDK